MSEPSPKFLGFKTKFFVNFQLRSFFNCSSNCKCSSILNSFNHVAKRVSVKNHYGHK